jgi:hypothetical protein
MTTPTNAPALLTASTADVHLATDPTRWELLVAAIHGGFPGTKALEIARKSVKFRGEATAARDQADRLVKAGILSKDSTEGSLIYRAAPKGELIYAHVVAAREGISSEGARTPAESRLLALVAHLSDADYEVLELGEPSQYDFLGALTNRLKGSAIRAQGRARIDPG